MTWLWPLLGGGVLGAAASALALLGTLSRLRFESGVLRASEEARRAECSVARREAEEWRAKYQSEQLERTRIEVTAKEQAQAHQERLAALTQVRGEIERDLKNITADALRANQGAFLELANQVFEKHKTGADAGLEARQKAVEAMVGPLHQTLQSYREQVDAMEKTRSQAYGVLSTELRAVAETQNAVRTETSKLVQALRAAPKTRGRWGEHRCWRRVSSIGFRWASCRT